MGVCPRAGLYKLFTLRPSMKLHLVRTCSGLMALTRIWILIAQDMLAHASVGNHMRARSLLTLCLQGHLVASAPSPIPRTSLHLAPSPRSTMNGSVQVLCTVASKRFRS